ncbi:hypothetical protein MLD38_001024 [Melastoma candidum]|uniref:Uncharacterized protein n=1 Tax=Melastoma candidum TaxID=119954 RepID=A0ACB9SCD0_9MYRT|nr:hypothetical protein MLD38_001024 [Melastoma candidum]
MRRISTSSIPSLDSKGGDPFMGFRPSLSPRWSNLALPPFPGQAPPRPLEGALSSQQLLPVPAPMPFGCSSSSPKSPLRSDLPGVPVLPDFPRIPAFALSRASSQPTERRGLRPTSA